MKTTHIRNLGLLLIALGILLFVGMLSCNGAELDPKFISAIHQVESGGKTGNIIGDNGKALGPLQIHYSYWKDSGVSGKYSQCTNLAYSIRVMTAYMNRYERNAVKSGDFETLARLHNAGPSWRNNKSSTNHYWQKVKNHMNSHGAKIS